MATTSPPDGQVLIGLLAGSPYPLPRLLLWRYVTAVERLMGLGHLMPPLEWSGRGHHDLDRLIDRLASAAA